MLNKLIKFHFNYVFNRINLLLFLLLSIFIFCSNMFIVIGIDNKAESNESFLYYLDSSFSIVSFIGVFFSITLFSFSFLQKQDQYIYLVISNKISRINYFISKYFSICLLVFFFIVENIILFYLPTIFSSKIKYIDINIVKSFFDLYLLILFYGNISLLLTLWLDSIYVILFPFTLFLIILNSSLESLSNLKKIINNIVISIEPGKWILYQENKKAILLIFIIFSINCLIYQKKDF